MRRIVVVLATWIALGSELAVVAADDTPQPPPPAPTQAPIAAPPVATTPTVLMGRVTDVLGKPIPAARVYVMPRGGGRLQTVTDQDGRYAIGLADGGAYSVVIAVGRVHTYRQVLVAARAATTP